MMRCPNCGGDVAESARTCGYCKVELATVRCHHCYAMNAARSAHCSGCGRELGLSPVGTDDERKCPTCKTSLLAFSGTGGVLLDCSSCGGQFVEHELLASLLESREVTGLAVPRRVRRASLELGSVRYVPCPACRELMNRKNFGGASGVVVDVCRAHGTWFEVGELPAVLAFVETGGLVATRQQEREREREFDRARTARMISGSSSAGPAMNSGDLESIADATMELLEWLASRWKIR